MGSGSVRRSRVWCGLSWDEPIRATLSPREPNALKFSSLQENCLKDNRKDLIGALRPSMTVILHNAFLYLELCVTITKLVLMQVWICLIWFSQFILARPLYLVPRDHLTLGIV